MKTRAQKRLKTLLLVLGLVGIIYGFGWFLSQKGDFVSPIDSSKFIAATRITESGSVAVVIDEQGNVTESAGSTPESTDRDLAWDPEGNRVFFISNRKEDSFHIFRWNPLSKGEPDQKSIDKAGRSNLSFDSQKSEIKELSALVTVRGTVQEFVPKTAESKLLMPPGVKQRLTQGEDDGGASTGMELMYKNFGTSFRIARWFKNRTLIAAVMRREDDGESLIVQDLSVDEDGKPKPPQLLFGAQKINLAVNPSDGNLVFSVSGVIPPMDDKGKPVKLPFKHAIFIFDPEKPNAEKIQPVLFSNNDENAFGQIAVNNEGSLVAFVAGKFDYDTGIESYGLVLSPLKLGGGSEAKPLAKGLISDPSFSPNGVKIAYAKRDGSSRSIFIIDVDGTGEKNLTSGKGNFSSPVFSPQYK